MLKRHRQVALLLAIIDAEQPITAETLGARFDAAVRTVYRDVAELTDAGAPIRGEAGVGYIFAHKTPMPGVALTFEDAVAVARALSAVALSASQRARIERSLFPIHPAIASAVRERAEAPLLKKAA